MAGATKKPRMSTPVLDEARLANLRPLRAVRQEEIDAFWRDGVVKLEQVLPPGATDFLADTFEDIFHGHEGQKFLGRNTSDLSKHAEALEASGEAGRLLVEGGYHEGKAKRTGRFRSEVSCFGWHTDFNRYVRSSPLPELVAQLLQSKQLKYYSDHLFYKEKGSLLRTAFHQDASFFALRGEQCAICWVPCDVVTKDSGAMGYVRGSHRWKDEDGKRLVFQAKNLVTDQASQPLKDYIPLPTLPDIEGNEKDYDIVYMEAKPGDVVIHHMNTIHGSAGNTSAERHRRAASIRYIGDDIVYDHAPGGTMLAVAAYDTPSAKLEIGPGKRILEKAQGAGTTAAAQAENDQKLMGMKPGDVLEGPMWPLCWEPKLLEPPAPAPSAKL